MKEDEMSKLKPCPFCGKDEAYLMTDKWGNYYVECEYCGAQINPYDDKEIIVEGWQSRPIEDELRARIAELEDDNRSLGDSGLRFKQNYEDLERDYGVMYDKMCARIDNLTAENKVLGDACEILRKENRKLFSKVFSNAYRKECEE